MYTFYYFTWLACLYLFTAGLQTRDTFFSLRRNIIPVVIIGDTICFLYLLPSTSILLTTSISVQRRGYWRRSFVQYFSFWFSRKIAYDRRRIDASDDDHHRLQSYKDHCHRAKGLRSNVRTVYVIVSYTTLVHLSLEHGNRCETINYSILIYRRVATGRRSLFMCAYWYYIIIMCIRHKTNRQLLYGLHIDEAGGKAFNVYR